MTQPQGVERYQRVKKLGEGAFGLVYLARDVVEDGRLVAVKKIRLGENVRDGVHFTALREIKLLKEMHHENVIGLFDVFTHNSNINLVYEFMDTDLERVIRDADLSLSPADIKGFMRQILEAVAFCHSNWVLHRDLKPSNLLLNSSGIVKLADFGLARTFGSPARKLTSRVVTRWYRAPELLYGAERYGPAVDMWAVGCIFAELMLRRPYMPGDNEIDQLARIFSTLGTPTEADWPGMAALPAYIPFDRVPGTPLRSTFTAAPDDALDLLGAMLRFNPVDRISAKDALAHPYFSSAPAPTPPARLPRPSSAPRPDSTPDLSAAGKERMEGGSARAVRSLNLSAEDTSGLFDSTPVIGHKRNATEAGLEDEDDARSVRRRLEL